MKFQQFYSNGKLLLTAEYLVLDGAKALAIPTKFGQFLNIKPIDEQIISWKSYDYEGTIWFEHRFTFEEILTQKSLENDPVYTALIEILYETNQLNPFFLKSSKGFEVETRLTFSRYWGLGTSSTLISNIAQWQGINPYKLLEKTFGGSGYDVACATHPSALYYQLENGLPIVEPTVFNPKFKENIYFLYLNQKQSSKVAILNYFSKCNDVKTEIKKINTITNQLVNIDNLKKFSLLMQNHEAIMSTILETETLQEKLFSDFNGTIKSLGAWGGDFAMVISKNNPKKYFEERGFFTLLRFDEMVLL